MSKAKELITTTDLVRMILKNHPEARNSDNQLYYLVIKNLGKQKGIDIESMSMPHFLLHMKDYNMPSIESVGRCRRKIVESHPELAGNSDVEAGRSLNEEIFRDYGRKVMV